MKKYFYSLVLATLLCNSVSLSAMKLTDDVENHSRGAIVSKGLQNTDQYNGIPKVPMVHPYNMSSLPGGHIILALQGKFPERLLENSGISPKVTQGINDAMKATGVTKDDPFFVVIQSYVPDQDIKYDVGQLLRPMYYFSPNTSATSETPYTEYINLCSQTVPLSGDGKTIITPDNPQTPNNFQIAVHNCLTKDGLVADKTLISSGNNMKVPTLKGQTYGFYGFYKAQGRTLNGKPVVPADTRGIGVLHLVLDQSDSLLVSSKLNGKKTINEVIYGLKQTHLTYTAGIINSMCDDAK